MSVCSCPRYHISYHTKFPYGEKDTEIWLSKDKKIMPVISLIDSLLTFGKVKIKNKLRKKKEGEIEYDDMFHEIPEKMHTEIIKINLDDIEPRKDEESEITVITPPEKKFTTAEITSEDIKIEPRKDEESEITVITPPAKEEYIDIKYIIDKYNETMNKLIKIYNFVTFKIENCKPISNTYEYVPFEFPRTIIPLKPEYIQFINNIIGQFENNIIKMYTKLKERNNKLKKIEC
ncbi:hypothetical protein Indivirus_1_175 [Indivirus ILV1]|uniref:Uncharacterized protein n=1 Tax=Indivirus ILV1 TaxID=1977633 RepID=A0A1V0SCW7_9VIRU|nr:hypothetical protein Indivirus_1_175 [Indivirus ILV1]